VRGIGNVVRGIAIFWAGYSAFRAGFIVPIRGIVCGVIRLDQQQIPIANMLPATSANDEKPGFFEPV